MIILKVDSYFLYKKSVFIEMDSNRFFLTILEKDLKNIVKKNDFFKFVINHFKIF